MWRAPIGKVIRDAEVKMVVHILLRQVSRAKAGRVPPRAREEAHHGPQAAKEKRPTSMSWCSSPASTPVASWRFQ